MTDYILDVAKWRCGGDGPNRLGHGRTKMLNDGGFSCCLGQFARQAGVHDDDLLIWATPGGVVDITGHAYDPSFVSIEGGFANDTTLAALLMRINDDQWTTPHTKIAIIRRELEAEGHTLTVLNEDMLSP